MVSKKLFKRPNAILIAIATAGLLLTSCSSSKQYVQNVNDLKQPTQTAKVSDHELALEKEVNSKLEKITFIDENDASFEVANAEDIVDFEKFSEDAKAAPNLKALTASKLKLESFDAVSNNQLVLELDRNCQETECQVELQKTAPSEFVIKVSDAELAEDIRKTLVLDNQSREGMRSIRLSQNDSDTEIRVFSDPVSDFKLDTEGNKIVLSRLDIEGNLIEEVADEINLDQVRAQSDENLDIDGAFEVNVDDLFRSQYKGRLISLDLQDTDIDNALRIIAEVSNLNIIASDDVKGKITLRLQDVPWDQALDVILKTKSLDMVREGSVVRIAPLEKLKQEREALKEAKDAEEELEPTAVQYIRVSYAKAGTLQPMIEGVLTERGTVTFDERTNQLIIQDISRGLANAVKLVEKLDLRTPQVLIESQIVEATRTFTRRMGSQLGFTFLRTPGTGNALPYNFPHSLSISGSGVDAAGQQTTNLVNEGNGETNAISFLFGSADGTKSLDLRLSQAESEGIARVISRPSVAVTNNEQATIKSVQKIRIKLPQGGGVSVGVGEGATSAGGGSTAAETIEVGIILEVTAQASPDYYVLLDIDAKSSTLGNAADSVDGIPPEIERSATSTVLVSSGQTFAMGGIYGIIENDDISGLPFFKDIPVLGHFFRSSTIRDSDQELLFFLTPRIIEGSFDDANLQAAS